MFDFSPNAWRKAPRKRRNTLKMAILTKKSKIFIKAKLTVSKSYLLGLIYLMIWCILRDAILQKVVYFKNESGTGVVFLALCMYLMVIIDNSLLFCLYIFVLEDLAFFPTVLRMASAHCVRRFCLTFLSKKYFHLSTQFRFGIQLCINEKFSNQNNLVFYSVYSLMK